MSEPDVPPSATAAGRDAVDPGQRREAEQLVFSAIPPTATGFDHGDLASTVVGLLADYGWRPTRPAAG